MSTITEANQRSKEIAKSLVEGVRESTIRITKIDVHCEVTKSANYKSVRCGLGAECEINGHADVQEAYDKVYNMLYDRCISCVDTAISKMVTEAK